MFYCLALRTVLETFFETLTESKPPSSLQVGRNPSRWLCPDYAKMTKVSVHSPPHALRQGRGGGLVKGGGAFAASPLSRKYLFVLNVSLQCVPAGATNLAVLTSTADSRAGWRSTLHPIAKNPADSTPSTRGRHLVASQLQSFLARASENNRGSWVVGRSGGGAQTSATPCFRPRFDSAFSLLPRTPASAHPHPHIVGAARRFL